MFWKKDKLQQQCKASADSTMRMRLHSMGKDLRLMLF